VTRLFKNILKTHLESWHTIHIIWQVLNRIFMIFLFC